jgi:DAK2 domain fusion protein YloV
MSSQYNNQNSDSTLDASNWHRLYPPGVGFSGSEFLAMFSAGMDALEENVQAINSLNVFPVPDGDTGTNMFLTMRSVISEGTTVASGTASEVALSMARGGLLGARGNSGVILSQFFRGFADGIAERTVVGTTELWSGFYSAGNSAYQSVGTPKEGTMLTCMHSISESMQDLMPEASHPGSTTREEVIDFWAVACRAASDALKRTPDLLPVLKRAGVVDAGGQGLCVILEGALRYLRNESNAIAVVGSENALNIAATQVKEDFLSETEEDLYGYCTEITISGEGLQVDQIRLDMSSMAASTVVVGDQNIVKVHVHVDDPGPILSYGATRGTLSQVKVENMDEQHQEFVQMHRKTTTKSAVCAITNGDGFVEIFQSLGATVVIGGQTMNPSAQEILGVVNKTKATNVIVLPNNKNIIPVAQQLDSLSDKSIYVVPTTSAPQGIAALLVFNPELEPDDNLAAMLSATEEIRTGEITHAVRSTSVDEMQIKKGETIGILDGELVTAGKTTEGIVLDLLDRISPEEENIITVYRGLETPQEDMSRIEQAIKSAHPRVELEIQYGGQPHYDYILSVE